MGSGSEPSEREPSHVPDDPITTVPKAHTLPRSVPRPPCRTHSVHLPPHATTFHKLKYKLTEIFFPDDPFHVYEDQTVSNRVILGFKHTFPILTWVFDYNLKLLKSDLIAGITIASLSIPQSISYAKLAALPPIIGLYSCFVPPLIYTVFGSSRHIGIGPVSVASLVMGSMLSESVSPSNEPDLYLRLAFTATFFAGIFEAALGFLRLGFIIDFLSKATLIGFTTGVAILVALQQLKGLIGIVHFTNKAEVIPVIKSVIERKEEWSLKTFIMGSCFLAFLMTAKQISARKPKLFWVTAAAPLASIVLSTLIVFQFKSQFQDVSKIGHLPRGINPPSVHKLYFNGPHLILVVKTGVMTAILSLAEAIAVGRTFACRCNYQISGNKEMKAIGIMNICGSLCSCYVTSGGFSRSAVNYNAGAKTAASNFIMALAVLLTLLFLMPLFTYTPDLVLSAIILSAVLGLIDYEGAYKLWQVDKLDFLSCVGSFIGVLFVSVQIGLTIAVGVSMFRIILNVSRPNTTLMGKIPGTQIYQSITLYENASRVPSFLILRIESPIMFANSTYLQERVLRWIREEEKRIQANGESDLRCVILDLGAVTNIDTTGIDAIRDLRKRMDGRSLQLVLVNPLALVVEKLDETRLLESFKDNGLYLTIGEAVVNVSSSWNP